MTTNKKIWFTSDNHFGHANVIDYSNRPFKIFKYKQINENEFLVFSSIDNNLKLKFKSEKSANSFCRAKNTEIMNEEMIRRWNDKISPEDIVYHVGDFSYLNPEENKKLLKRLNGYLILIKGNHDQSKNKMIEYGFNEAHNELHITLKNGQEVELNHYPFLDKELVPYKNMKIGKVVKIEHADINADEDPLLMNPILPNTKCQVCGKSHVNNSDTIGCFKTIMYKRLDSFDKTIDFFKTYYGKKLGTANLKGSHLSMVITILNKTKKRLVQDKPVNVGQILGHGHVHTLWKVKGNMINFSVEQWDYSPVSEDQLIEEIKKMGKLP